MPDKIIALLKKRREPLGYVIFGLLTTAVGQASFMVFLRILPELPSAVPTAAAWIVAVSFAYTANRRWVFCSKSRGARAIIREIASFFSARIFSLLVAVAIMWVMVDILAYNADLTKLASNVPEAVLNYLFSKFWVFKRPLA